MKAEKLVELIKRYGGCNFDNAMNGGLCIGINCNREWDTCESRKMISIDKYVLDCTDALRIEERAEKPSNIDEIFKTLRNKYCLSCDNNYSEDGTVNTSHCELEDVENQPCVLLRVYDLIFNNEPSLTTST
jgi:hypothetical protein